MFVSIIITLFITVAAFGALRTGRGGELIARRPYNNRYSDAAAAREDHLG